MPTDAELLRRYVEHHDEGAFAELVRQNLDLVHATALRRAGGRAHLAEEIAQKVFCDLARKAAGLARHPALSGWLHQSTRYAAIDAMRSEHRRQKLAQSLSAMPDVDARSEPAVDWERLRPVIDEAMDQLTDRDREIVLQRFFKGLTFAELATRLTVPESTARLRAERALEKLRIHLGKHGVTSTSAALGLLLANQPLAAAPASLAASVTAAGLATAPVGGTAGLLSFFLMNKITVSIVSAVVAAASTALVSTSLAPGVSTEELAALRQENVRLSEATGPNASRASVAAVADEYAAQVTAIAQAMASRQSRLASASATTTRAAADASAGPSVTARGHRNHGMATPLDAQLTFAWASDAGDPDELAKVITFDPAVRDKAAAVLASMPESIRAQYPTPEKFYGMLYAVEGLEAPPPGEDLIEQGISGQDELRPGRIALQTVGSRGNFHEFQQTSDGWKYVVPEVAVVHLPGNLNSETLAKLPQP